MKRSLFLFLLACSANVDVETDALKSDAGGLVVDGRLTVPRALVGAQLVAVYSSDIANVNKAPSEKFAWSEFRFNFPVEAEDGDAVTLDVRDARWRDTFEHHVSLVPGPVTLESGRLTDGGVLLRFRNEHNTAFLHLSLASALATVEPQNPQPMFIGASHLAHWPRSQRIQVLLDRSLPMTDLVFDAVSAGVRYWDRILGDDVISVQRSEESYLAPGKVLVVPYLGAVGLPLIQDATGTIVAGAIGLPPVFLTHVIDSDSFIQLFIAQALPTYADTNPSRFYAANTCAHEMGHVLGLMHNFAGAEGAEITWPEVEPAYLRFLQTGELPTALLNSTVMDYNDTRVALLQGARIVQDPTFVAPYDEAIMAWLYDKRESSVYFCADSDIGGRRWGCERGDASSTRLLYDVSTPQPFYFTGAFIDLVRSFRAQHGPLTSGNIADLVIEYYTTTYNLLGLPKGVMDYFQSSQSAHRTLGATGPVDLDDDVWSAEYTFVQGRIDELLFAQLYPNLDGLPAELDTLRPVLVDHAYTPFLDLGMQWSAEEFDLARAAFVASLPEVRTMLRNNVALGFNNVSWPVQANPGIEELAPAYAHILEHVMLSVTSYTPVQVTLTSGEVRALQRPTYEFEEGPRHILAHPARLSPEMNAARARVGEALAETAIEPALVAQADAETRRWLETTSFYVRYLTQ